ncbi:MAG: Asp-tRNA(Asn)/Glu-tRNA(Gln) amidotransferase subunit GatA [Candidatus Cyclobacteriaceae bacterium M3_2C_046]
MEPYASYQPIVSLLKSGQTTCRKVVEYYLANIDQQNQLNVFLEVFAEEALAKADEVDIKIAQGTAGHLAGMVIGIKDVLCYKAHKTQASSRILEGFESQYTGSALQKVIDQDAIIIGRINCDEFGMGSSNENSAFGPVRNGLAPDHVPGGSSGGSAVAVQMNMCTASLGSDTGGSIRQPAAFCGVVGLKPTYGRISRYGLIAYASSFDTIGILARTVEDTALLLEVMAGADQMDSTVSCREVPAYTSGLENQIRKGKVAYLKDTFQAEGLDPEILEQTRITLNGIKQDGYQVDGVEFPWLKYILPTYYILITAEASANLARYDGVKFGYRDPNPVSLEKMYKKTRSEGFGQEVKRRIMLGTFVLSASYYDAYYTKAQKVRRLIKEKTEELFQSYDFLILPTTPSTAFKLGENNQNPLEMYLADLFTVQASVTGIPAISLPNGTDSQGLPIGLQVMASAFKEQELLAFSNYLMIKNQVAV